MIISKLKTWLIAAAGAVISVLVIVLNVLISRNKSLKDKLKTSTATAKKARDVIEADLAINEQEDVRLKESKDEIDEGKPPKELTDPNDWEWVDD